MALSTLEDPGRYDDLCEQTREKAEAKMVALMIVGGNRGEGFSVQTTDPRLLITLPGILRSVAEQIELDMAKEAEEDR